LPAPTTHAHYAHAAVNVGLRFCLTSVDLPSFAMLPHNTAHRDAGTRALSLPHRRCTHHTTTPRFTRLAFPYLCARGVSCYTTHTHTVCEHHTLPATHRTLQPSHYFLYHSHRRDTHTCLHLPDLIYTTTQQHRRTLLPRTVHYLMTAVLHYAPHYNTLLPLTLPTCVVLLPGPVTIRLSADCLARS